jgi:IstB-like ATP binding protein
VCYLTTGNISRERAWDYAELNRVHFENRGSVGLQPGNAPTTRHLRAEPPDYGFQNGRGLGYVPLAGAACELMFQVIADRAEKAAVIVTTNLPFSEWSQVIPNPRLCKALIDRLTDQAPIITTGTDSYRFRRTSAQRKAAKS